MERHEELHLEELRDNLAECTVLLKCDNTIPLHEPCDIALYGNGARNTIKGGTGSGEVNSRFFINIESGFEERGFNILTKDWLDEYDKKRKKMKKCFKKELKKIAKEKNVPLYIAAMGEVMPEGEYNIPIDVKCDTCIYVLSRISGEGSDRRPIKGDLYLSDTEIRDIKFLNKNYKKFILILNTCGVVDLNPISEVRNILLLSQLGVETGLICTDILLGKYNPSGKLSTTWDIVADHQNNINFGEMDDTRYKEGIYVGYRYFNSLNRNMLYPFGYGLSYTKFDIKHIDSYYENKNIYIKLLVKNIGNYPGKETVMAYISKPNDRINQAGYELVSFSKTKELDKGEVEELTLSFDLRDITTFDNELSSYLLLKGSYIVGIGNRCDKLEKILSIDIKDDIVIKKVKKLFGKVDFNDDIYNYKNEIPDNINHIEINKDDFETIIVDYNQKYDVLDEIKKLDDETLAKLNMGLFDPNGGLRGMIGASGVSVAGAAGETYKIEGLEGIVMADGPQGLRIAKDYFKDEKGAHSLGSLVPESMMEYFPWIIKVILNLLKPKKGKNEVLHQYTTAIPISTAIAQSFNKNFAYLCGDIIGSEMDIYNIDLWLAPGMNIHRSVLCGRNFEYYSEDPYLSGIMASSIINGLSNHKGRSATIKHFLCNNQELNRYRNNSMVSERTIREIYLKGFELALKYSNPCAIMTSYNLLNSIHTNENNNINELIIRNELGFKGMVMTDWVVNMLGAETKYKDSNIVKVLKSHSDIFMPGSKKDYDILMNGLKTGLITRDDLEINASHLYNAIKELKR